MSTKSPTIRLLAISGSLRRGSSNTALLRAAQALAPENIMITLYTRLGELPHFNLDNEFNELEAVADLKAQVEAADGLIISSPEYAHGVPGTLKNGLDWLVGGPEFYEKPVAFFNASGRGVYAQAALREIVKTMSGKIIDEACMTLPFLGKHLTGERIQSDSELSNLVRSAIKTFAKIVAEQEES